MSKKIKADTLLLVITAVWGASFSLMKNVLEHIPSFAYLSLRFILATLVLVIIFHKKFRLINKRVIIYGCIIGLMLFGGMALQVIGLYYTTASNSAFITGFYVPLVPVLSAIFLKKRPNAAAITGVILAFAGMFFLSGGVDFDFNKGDFLTLLCAVCFTFQIVLIDKFTANEDAALLAIIQIGFATVLFTVCWPIFDFKSFSLDSTVITTLIITGLFGTALAFAGQTMVQRFTSPTHTALIFAAEPVFGAVFALIIPNSMGVTESLRINSIIGCLLILVGMIISEIRLTGKIAESTKT